MFHLAKYFKKEPNIKRDGDTWLVTSKFCEPYINNLDFPYLVSFPRTGSHWLRMLMELYFNNPSLVRIFYFQNNHDFTCYHTHDIDLKTTRRNVIYLYRDPVDTVFSQIKYHNEDIDDQIRIRYWTFLYGQHLAKWLVDENFTQQKATLTYEGLKSNLELEFKQLCSFFNKQLDKERLSKVSDRVSKQKLKKKNISDPMVVQISKNYEKTRDDFRGKNQNYIYENIQHIYPDTISFQSMCK